METKTVLNPRKNYFTESEISHLWAHQLRKQAHKKGANHYQFYFENKTIYSYGPHFPIASLFGKKNEYVAITTRSYSNTTSGHISEVKSAISHYDIDKRIYCKDPQAAVNDRHITNLEAFENAAQNAAQGLAKAKKPSIYFNQIAAQKQMFDLYCKAFKIKVSPKKYPYLHIQPSEAELQKIKEQAKKEEARKKEQEEKKQAELSLQLSYWIEGKKYSDLNPEGSHLLIPAPYELNNTYLRVIDNQVQTSKGIELPIETAQRFYNWYINTVGAGGCVNCNKEILGYKVTKADSDGLIVGCHNITRSEINRIANILNW